MKLEEIHICSYLPHEVYCYIMGHNDELNNPMQERILGIFDNNEITVTLSDNDSDSYYIEDIKLILRPLSDLVSPKFASLGNEMNGVYSRQKVIDIINGVQDISVVSFYYIQLLLQNHFDIFGLIKNNLAIDINTLNQSNNETII